MRLAERKEGMGMTDKEVLAEMQADTPLNRARQQFSSAMAQIEQAGQQRQPATILELRAMEFEAVRKIAEIFGVKLEEAPCPHCYGTGTRCDVGPLPVYCTCPAGAKRST